MDVQPGNQSWAQRASQGGTVPCPICKEPLQKDTDLHAVSSESDGNSAILWQMLCGVKVMCANHSRCNSEGKCNWTGDYGSYQEHIRCCANTPLAQFENKASNYGDMLNPESNMTTSDCAKLEDNTFEAATTASELSEQIDSEHALESEHADSDNLGECESAGLPSPPQDCVLLGGQEMGSDSSSDFDEPIVEANPSEDKSLTELIADLIQLRGKPDCQPHDEHIADAHAVATISSVAAQEANATHSTLNVDAAPFEPPKAQNTSKPKRSSKKHAAPNTHAYPTSHVQAAALQYQATQAHMAQMAQMAYLQRLRSAQLAHYQTAYLQAHVNQMRLAQRYAP